MISFEIKINGQKVCKAGLDTEHGIFTAMLEWVRRDLTNFPLESQHKIPKEELRLDVVGSITHGKDDHENLEWVHRSLSVGDEINITIIDSTEVDEPESRKRLNLDFVNISKRKYYEQLKREYENG